jgi:hypothetical protein
MYGYTHSMVTGGFQCAMCRETQLGQEARIL